MNRLVSIICPIRNEKNFIQSCIDTLLSQDYPKDKMEIILVDGMSNDGTREIIQANIKQQARIKLIDNPDQVVPHALNLGIRAAQGEIIMRVDAHSEYPTNYVSVLSTKLIELDADNVGGVLNTLPAAETTISKAIAIASSHVFGVGDSKHKTGSNQIIETDTVPFGCYKRDVFEKIGLFDEDLIRNQDDEFNARLLNNGGKIYLIPEISINYYARSNLSKMAMMYYQYGLFKPLVNSKLGRPATLRQFFPPLFTIGLILGLVLSCISKYFLFIYTTILLIYATISLYIGIQSAIRNKSLKLACHIPMTFFIIHISYGWGYLKGLFKIMTKTHFNVQPSR